MKHLLLHFIAFGCLGITTEIFFTAITDTITELIAKKQKGGTMAINWSLTGYSYIWMFFIYGLVAFLFPIGYQYVAPLPLLFRLFIYMLGIFAIEFLMGWLLEKFTGRCPWHYTSRWAIKGFIRLDYFAFWMAFGWILEVVFVLLNKAWPLI